MSQSFPRLGPSSAGLVQYTSDRSKTTTYSSTELFVREFKSQDDAAAQQHTRNVLLSGASSILQQQNLAGKAAQAASIRSSKPKYDAAAAFDAGKHAGSMRGLRASIKEAKELQAVAVLDPVALAVGAAKAAEEKDRQDEIFRRRQTEPEAQAKADEAKAAARRSAAKKVADKGKAPPGMPAIIEMEEPPPAPPPASPAPPAPPAMEETRADDGYQLHERLVRLPPHALIAELYPKHPSDAQRLLRRLLQAMFLDALSHDEQQIIISERALDEAALAAEKPEIERAAAEAAAAARAAAGVQQSDVDADSAAAECAAAETAAAVLAKFREPVAMGQRAVPPTAGEVRQACRLKLTTGMQAALRAVRDAMVADEMSLLRRVSTAPVPTTAVAYSGLSIALWTASELFSEDLQTIFIARALCDTRHRLPLSAPPWRWDARRMGILAFGDLVDRQSFGCGLLHAVGAASRNYIYSTDPAARATGALDLSNNQLGDDLPTALLAVSLLARAVLKLTLRCNSLGTNGAITLLAQYGESAGNNTLEILDLSTNELDAFGLEHVARLLDTRGSELASGLLWLDLSDNCVTVWPTDPLATGAPAEPPPTKRPTIIRTASTRSMKGVERLCDALSYAQLSRLDLAENRLGDDGADLVAKMLECNATIQFLDLSGNNLRNAGVGALARALTSSKSLLQLTLARNHIDASAGGSKWRNTGMTKPVHGTELTSEKLASALHETQDFTNEEWRAFGIEGLRHEHYIKVVDGSKWPNIGTTRPVHGTELTNQKLASALHEKQEFTKEEWRAFGIEGLRLDHYIKSGGNYFQPGGNYFQPAASGFKALTDALHKNQSLIVLDLSVNNIGNTGVGYVARMLKANRQLDMISLQSNQLQEEAAAKLADALKRNKTLRYLFLDSNGLFGGDYLGVGTSNRGAIKIGEMLQVNTTLHTLSLGNTGLGTEGVQKIADALKGNRALAMLNLQTNNLCKEAVGALAEALQSNTTLRGLDLQLNGIDDESKALLVDACAGDGMTITFAGPGDISILWARFRSRYRFDRFDETVL